MDKLAMLKIKKKQALEEERRRAGLEEGDLLRKKELSQEEEDEINKSLGYPKEPLGVWCVAKKSGKEHAAAVWWTYDGPGPWVEPPPKEEPPPAVENEPPPSLSMKGLSRRFSMSFRNIESPLPSSPSAKSSIFDEGEEEEDVEVDWGAAMNRKKVLTKEEKQKAKKEAKAKKIAEEAEAQRVAEEERLAAEEKELLGTEKTMALVGWEIARYRREPQGMPGSGVESGWKYKGSVTMEPHDDNKMQTLLFDLGENNEYRFTVRAINGRGRGIESKPSNSVMIEEPLPAGWLRFYDEKLERQYYANIKTASSSWERPDFDPYFLDEAVVMLFNKAEIAHLKDIYDEEYAHFRAVLRERFNDVLREVGERMSSFRAFKLFKGYSTDAYQIETWQIFMDIMVHIKKRKMEAGLQGLSAAGSNARLLVKQRLASSMLTKTDKDRYKNWILEWSNIADRQYYRNVVTKQKQWDLPDEIRFYLPPRLEAKLLSSFDFGHLELFKKYFSLLDLNNTGDLSPNELRLIFEALMLELSDGQVDQLVQTVDLNGNGTIEFDEFCYMMCELARTDGKGGLSGVMGGGGGLGIDLAVVSANLQRLQNNGGAVVITPRGEMIPPPPSSSSSSVTSTQKEQQRQQQQQQDDGSTSSVATSLLSVREKPSPSPSPSPSPAAAIGSPLSLSLTRAAAGSLKRVTIAIDEGEGVHPVSSAQSANDKSHSHSHSHSGPLGDVDVQASPSSPLSLGATSDAGSGSGGSVSGSETREGEEGAEGGPGEGAREGGMRELPEGGMRELPEGEGAEPALAQGEGEGGGEREGEGREEKQQQEEEEEEEWIDEIEEEEEDGEEDDGPADASRPRRKAVNKSTVGRGKGSSGPLKRLYKRVWDAFHPKAHKAELLREAEQARAEQKKKDMHALKAARDAGSVHGPYCFCGCRAF